MKLFTTLLCFVLLFKTVSAQDSVLARIVLIGDAGEMDAQQRKIIPDAAGRNLPGKTTYFYLGDNIYPHGMALPGDPDEARTQEVLRSQYEPIRAVGAPVYFIPGNHDWDRMGPKGLAKIKQQSAFLQQQNDSLLQLVPANGCPDPVAIPLTDSLVVIALDSEWWLFQFDKANEDGDCSCHSTTEILQSLRALFYEHRHKTILLATHHPFQSYGTHGGYFSWKDHLFPLTVINPDLYVPLPLIGSIYPLYRKTFTHPEDLRHPLYKEMIRNIDGVFGDFPNLIHVSGHEHGLQLIDNKKTEQLQVVSGGGAKENYTIKGKHSLYGEATQGYVVADLYAGNRLVFHFYTYQNDSIKETFTFEKKYQPYTDAEPLLGNTVTTDSLLVAAHPQYANEQGFYRFIFGKNYRKEWSTPIRLPALRLSQIHGGLMPVKLGGGFQSTSLRLKDSSGKEYTLRTVEKKADLVVPLPFQGTFVRELLDDATSAQHPYSALVVDPLATAIGVPHATPSIGVVAADTNLQQYQSLLEGKVALLEEREPMGDSDNFIKALDNLQKDNDNSYDAYNFLKARMLDVLLADWDRHGDQWRFYNSQSKGEPAYYTLIPRDRDMVFNVTEGLLPSALKRFLLMPKVFGFSGKVSRGARYYLYKSTFLAAHPASQFSRNDWQRAALEMKAALTDSVLRSGLEQMPPEIQSIRNEQLLEQLQERRDGLAAAMDQYYKLSNKVVDIRTSNKNEYFQLEDEPGGKGIRLLIRKINKHGKLSDTLACKLFPNDITREIRLYASKGDDSFAVNVSESPIRLRIIGGKGDKAYNIISSRKSIPLYDRKPARYYGEDAGKLRKHIDDDSAHTAFVPVNMYNTALPLLTAGINPDDGILLGAGFRYLHQFGFRKAPYASMQQLMVSHSFSTDAFRIKYNGAWLSVLAKKDITLAADIRAPDNTQNFFGKGNETVLDRSGNFKRYYRTRFNLLSLDAAIRSRGSKGTELSIGPAIQYYRLDPEDNIGRFINRTELINSYDSSHIDEDKLHAGIHINFELDQRNSKVLPTWGSYARLQINAMGGVNTYARSFIQVIPEVALYKSLNARQSVVLADRFGGGITIGQPAFYQSMFLGGQGNLSGYRQYRFAGQHSLYNNLELRVAIADFGNYILKGQLGIIAFYDIGRVWQPGERSGQWHQGTGASLYLAPASLVVFRLNAAWSNEGWYPGFSMGFRF